MVVRQEGERGQRQAGASGSRARAGVCGRGCALRVWALNSGEQRGLCQALRGRAGLTPPGLPETAACDGDPQGGEKAAWARVGRSLCAGVPWGQLPGRPMWSDGGREGRGQAAGRRAGSDPAGLGLGDGQGPCWQRCRTPPPPPPQDLPPSTHVFNKDFLYLPPHSRQGRGAEWGTGHRMLISKGTVHRQTLRVDTHLPIRGCAQDSCPHPRTQGKHPPGSLGLRQRQGPSWTACGLASLTSWGLLPSSPAHPLSPRSCLSGIIWGLFFWGIVLLHDPS